MGVSAVGERGIRPRSIPVLLYGMLVTFGLVFYLFGPPLAPGMRDAAEDKCNELVGGNYRSFRLEWTTPPWHPTWDLPHWSCRDVRAQDKDPVSFGWWVSPF